MFSRNVVAFDAIIPIGSATIAIRRVSNTDVNSSEFAGKLNELKQNGVKNSFAIPKKMPQKARVLKRTNAIVHFTAFD
jgi:hypothetical protein